MKPKIGGNHIRFTQALQDYCKPAKVNRTGGFQVGRKGQELQTGCKLCGLERGKKGRKENSLIGGGLFVSGCKTLYLRHLKFMVLYSASSLPEGQRPHHAPRDKFPHAERFAADHPPSSSSTVAPMSARAMNVSPTSMASTPARSSSSTSARRRMPLSPTTRCADGPHGGVGWCVPDRRGMSAGRGC